MAVKKAAKKAVAKKAPAKKAPAKKVAAKKAPAKKAPAKKVAAKKPAAKKAAPKAKKPRAAGGGIAQPVALSADLAGIVGATSLSRGELTKRIWDYIKKNGLQDQKNRRQINADAKLKVIFGGKNQVSMFEMTKLVNKHVK
ncbi:SWIB/MDM2 domain-containing protein [Solimonas sp. SE-A11]|uniref:SWIB/MDM2 domain-containing protein n=1 Tax=Solimonas sp. SE-A11 TaxID=3054954 RepID=UPI00259CF353|nr:SWIB/MDM2 domain-containing protein [Solimonas sp. SE-A11]MDM4772526.1 SWIB/MDM2 domain-containing protein [Solimonas sp. SE-A11]